MHNASSYMMYDNIVFAFWVQWPVPGYSFAVGNYLLHTSQCYRRGIGDGLGDSKQPFDARYRQV